MWKKKQQPDAKKRNNFWEKYGRRKNLAERSNG